MGPRSWLESSILRCSVLVSVLLVVAVGPLASAQSIGSSHAHSARSLASTGALSHGSAFSAVHGQQQRRRLQQQGQQAQPAVYTPYNTESSTRRPRPQNVGIASTQQLGTTRTRRQQRTQQVAATQQIPTPAALPVPVETPIPDPAEAATTVPPTTVAPTTLPGSTTTTTTTTVAPIAVTAPVLPAEPNITVDMSPGAAGIGPSILLMGHFDWQNIPDANGKPWSRCLDMVWRARRVSRGNKINFVPTHHWLPRDDGFGVSRYCYMHKDAGVPDSVTTTNGMYCSPWNDALIQEFEDTMTTCIAEALRQGFTTYFRPHLDDGLTKGIWRNGLLFSPTVKYGAYSYQDIMLSPLSRALSRALRLVSSEGQLWPRQDRLRPVVYMALQGEMSATIMRYTADWQTLIPVLRTTIGNRFADVKIGIGLNFNALDAVEGGTPPPDGGLVGWLVSSSYRATQSVPSIDPVAVNKLVSQDVDFIGISAYAPYTGPGMALNEFENSAFNVGESLRILANGVDLAGLINTGKVELHYSEFGLGGGNEGNSRPASSARMAGKQPWAGVAGPYNSAYDPWYVPELRDYRTEFFTKALQWLADPNIKTYKVSDVFVWGMASWDVFGVYPDSVAYRDLALVQRMADHNLEVVVAQVNAAKDSDNARLVLKQLNSIDGGADGVTSNVGIVNDRVQVTGSVNYDAVPPPAPPSATPSGGWGWLFGR